MPQIITLFDRKYQKYNTSCPSWPNISETIADVSLTNLLNIAAEKDSDCQGYQSCKSIKETHFYHKSILT